MVSFDVEGSRLVANMPWRASAPARLWDTERLLEISQLSLDALLDSNCKLVRNFLDRDSDVDSYDLNLCGASSDLAQPGKDAQARTHPCRDEHTAGHRGNNLVPAQAAGKQQPK